MVQGRGTKNDPRRSEVGKGSGGGGALESKSRGWHGSLQRGQDRGPDCPASQLAAGADPEHCLCLTRTHYQSLSFGI